MYWETFLLLKWQVLFYAVIRAIWSDNLNVYTLEIWFREIKRFRDISNADKIYLNYCQKKSGRLTQPKGQTGEHIQFYNNVQTLTNKFKMASCVWINTVIFERQIVLAFYFDFCFVKFIEWIKWLGNDGNEEVQRQFRFLFAKSIAHLISGGTSAGGSQGSSGSCCRSCRNSCRSENKQQPSLTSRSVKSRLDNIRNRLRRCMNFADRFNVFNNRLYGLHFLSTNSERNS